MIAPDKTDFQRELDAFNEAKGPPSKIAVAWNGKTNRWQVYAVPIADSYHPLARNDVTRALIKPFCDGTGEGILLFTWCDRDPLGHDAGFRPLDRRLFETLDFADSFKDKDHFQHTITDSHFKAEAAQKKEIRDIAAAGEYWAHINRTLVAMTAAKNQRADWRAKQYWR